MNEPITELAKEQIVELWEMAGFKQVDVVRDMFDIQNGTSCTKWEYPNGNTYLYPPEMTWENLFRWVIPVVDRNAKRDGCYYRVVVEGMAVELAVESLHSMLVYDHYYKVLKKASRDTGK